VSPIVPEGTVVLFFVKAKLNDNGTTIKPLLNKSRDSYRFLGKQFSYFVNASEFLFFKNFSTTESVKKYRDNTYCM
jgi:hypothetical protein